MAGVIEGLIGSPSICTSGVFVPLYVELAIGVAVAPVTTPDNVDSPPVATGPDCMLDPTFALITDVLLGSLDESEDGGAEDPPLVGGDDDRALELAGGALAEVCGVPDEGLSSRRNKAFALAFL